MATVAAASATTVLPHKRVAVANALALACLASATSAQQQSTAPPTSSEYVQLSGEGWCRDSNVPEASHNYLELVTGQMNGYETEEAKQITVGECKTACNTRPKCVAIERGVLQADFCYLLGMAFNIDDEETESTTTYWRYKPGVTGSDGKIATATPLSKRLAFE